MLVLASDHGATLRAKGTPLFYFINWFRQCKVPQTQSVTPSRKETTLDILKPLHTMGKETLFHRFLVTSTKGFEWKAVSDRKDTCFEEMIKIMVTCCCGLNVCVPLKILCWTSVHNAVIVGGRAFMNHWGQRGKAWRNGISLEIYRVSSLLQTGRRSSPTSRCPNVKPLASKIGRNTCGTLLQWPDKTHGLFILGFNVFWKVLNIFLIWFNTIIITL